MAGNMTTSNTDTTAAEASASNATSHCAGEKQSRQGSNESPAASASTMRNTASSDSEVTQGSTSNIPLPSLQRRAVNGSPGRSTPSRLQAVAGEVHASTSTQIGTTPVTVEDGEEHTSQSNAESTTTPSPSDAAAASAHSSPAVRQSPLEHVEQTHATPSPRAAARHTLSGAASSRHVVATSPHLSLRSVAHQPSSSRAGSIVGVGHSTLRLNSSSATRRHEVGPGTSSSAASLGAHLSQQPQGNAGATQSASSSLFGFSGASNRANSGPSLDDFLSRDPVVSHFNGGHTCTWTIPSTSAGTQQQREAGNYRPPYLVAQQQQQQPRTAITSFLAPGATSMPSHNQQSHGSLPHQWSHRSPGSVLAGSRPRASSPSTLPSTHATQRFGTNNGGFPTTQVSTGSSSGWTRADPAGWNGWPSAARVGSAFEENQVVLFTWTIPEVDLLREEVEQSPPPSEVERSVSAGAGKSEVWTTQPIFGDGKWKLELVRNLRQVSSRTNTLHHGDEGEELTSTTTALTVYITSMVLDYSPPDLEIPATVMIGIRAPQSHARSSRDGAWIWRRFFQYTFRQENEFLECHELPTISELLEDSEVRAQDCFNLSVQVSTGPRATPSARANCRSSSGGNHARHGSASPFVVEDNQLVHHSLIHGLERLIDCRATGDVLLIARERGVKRGADKSEVSASGRIQLTSTDNQDGEIGAVPIGTPCDADTLLALQSDGGTYTRDRVLWAHSSILCARSEFFKVMLESSFSEGQELTVEGRRVRCLRVQDSDYTTIYWLLRYLYLEEVDFMPHEDVRSAALDDDWTTTPGPSTALDHAAAWDWTPTNRIVANGSEAPESSDCAGITSSHAKDEDYTTTESRSQAINGQDADVQNSAMTDSLCFDPHEHPCDRPPPASALALYRLAHRYHQEGLLHLAKAHIISTLTPQSAFALLLATSVYDDLHSHIKAYVLEKWEMVSQTPEFERCCDEVSSGEWGTDAGRALRAFMRSLVSPSRTR